MSDSRINIEGRQYQDTLILDRDAVKEGKVAILSYPYSLTEAQFNILKKEDQGLGVWIKRLQLIGLGYLLTIISKVGVFIYEFKQAANTEAKGQLELGVANWEFVSIVIVILAIGLASIVNRFVESERDEVVNHIEEHFSSHK